MSESIVHLLHRAGQLADETLADAGLDVTTRQAAVLTALAELEEASQTQLVNATGIDRSTMADLVRRLSVHGLVTRKRSNRDARANRVRLTARGAEIAREARVLTQDTNRTLLKRLPAPMRKPFEESLQLLALGYLAADAPPLRDRAAAR